LISMAATLAITPPGMMCRGSRSPSCS
jgi:hypothetical protein